MFHHESSGERMFGIWFICASVMVKHQVSCLFKVPSQVNKACRLSFCIKDMAVYCQQMSCDNSLTMVSM